MRDIREYFTGKYFKSTRRKLQKIVLDDNFKKELIDEMNYRLLIMETDALSVDENILWLEDIMITPIKKPGIKELINRIIQRICSIWSREAR